MSTGPLRPSASQVDKVDVRKYVFVLRRRLWWGVIPTVLLIAVFAVICRAVPPKYRSTCVIRSSKSKIADIIGAGSVGEARTSRAIVSEEMLRYDRVMEALADTGVMKEIEQKAEGNQSERTRLQEELYHRVKNNTHIGSMGSVLIRVSFLGDDRDEAFEILNRLVLTFVEKALERERKDLQSARELAHAELVRAVNELDSIDSRLNRFREDHPGLFSGGETGKRAQLNKLNEDIDLIERQISSRRRKLDRILEQIESMPKQIIKEVKKHANPEVEQYQKQLISLRSQLQTASVRLQPIHPDIIRLKKDIQQTEQALAQAKLKGEREEFVIEPNKDREKLVMWKLELEAALDGDREVLRNLNLRKARLEEEVHAEPALRRQLDRLERDREVALGRYEKARTNFRKIDREFTVRMEGLVSFSIVAPPRRPHRKDMRHVYKLAIMGLFIAVFSGAAAVAGTEFIDQSFTDVETARDYLRLPSLGVIPNIETPGDRRSWLVRTTAIVIAAVMLIAAAAVSILYVPAVQDALQVVWAVIKDLCKDLV
jgi:uncharacterized protein involved in exopolysaccharide biosynthesis